MFQESQIFREQSLNFNVQLEDFIARYQNEAYANAFIAAEKNPWALFDNWQDLPKEIQQAIKDDPEIIRLAVKTLAEKNSWELLNNWQDWPKCVIDIVEKDFLQFALIITNTAELAKKISYCRQDKKSCLMLNAHLLPFILEAGRYGSSLLNDSVLDSLKKTYTQPSMTI